MHDVEIAHLHILTWQLSSAWVYIFLYIYIFFLVHPERDFVSLRYRALQFTKSSGLQLSDGDFLADLAKHSLVKRCDMAIFVFISCFCAHIPF